MNVLATREHLLKENYTQLARYWRVHAGGEHASRGGRHMPAMGVVVGRRAAAGMQTQAGIGAVTAEDIPRVVEVWEESVRATHHFLIEADIQLLKPSVWDGLTRALHQLACVRDGAGQVVGFIGVEGTHVDSLFIHPAWRGQGIGCRLLTYAIETLGATELDVNEQNDQATGFYRHMGFEVIGRSAVDGMGLPFPLLHLRLRTQAQAREPLG